MTAKITWRRRWSRRFTAAAAALLPKREKPWGDAMKAEIEAIEDERDGLRWAWGCLRTACVRRMGSVLTDHRNARALVGAYLLLLSIAPLCLFAFGLIYQMGSERAIAAVNGRKMAHVLPLLFDSVPVLIFFFLSGGLVLTSALTVVTRRLRTAAELMIVWLALNCIFELGVYLFFPAVSAVLPSSPLTLWDMIRAALNVCLPLWLWCARSVERESLGTSAR